MKDKQRYILLRENVHHMSGTCPFALHKGISSVDTQLDSIGGKEEVGSERGKDPSLFFALTGSESVYCHKQEERGRE